MLLSKHLMIHYGFIVCKYLPLSLSLVMGLGQTFLTWVGSIFCSSGRIRHLWFGFGKFPLKASNFSIFFPSSQKNLIWSGQKVPGSKVGLPLIYCGSRECSGRVRAPLYRDFWKLDIYNVGWQFRLGWEKTPNIFLRMCVAVYRLDYFDLIWDMISYFSGRATCKLLSFFCSQCLGWN